MSGSAHYNVETTLCQRFYFWGGAASLRSAEFTTASMWLRFTAQQARLVHAIKPDLFLLN
jgi:hypothetical protein